MQWASRTDSLTSPRSPIGSPPRSHTGPEEPQKKPSKEQAGTPSGAAALRKAFLFSPSEQRMAADSPSALTPGEEEKLQIAKSDTSHPDGQRWSSPPNIQLANFETDEAHRTFTFPKSQREVSINSSALPRPSKESERVDHGPGAMSMPLETGGRSRQKEPARERSSSPRSNPVDEDGVRRRDTLSREEAAGQLPPGHVSEPKPRGEAGEEAWGVPFKIQWIRTDKLSFLRTRHLRNPWNHDREVKVSRDGTEIEPSVGAALLAEWDKLDSEAQPPPPPPPTSRRGGGGGSRASFRSGSSVPTHSHSSHSHYQQSHGDRS